MTAIERAREVIGWCRQLAKLSEDRSATTRTFLSGPMREVHTLLAAWLARTGMTVRDAIRGFGLDPNRIPDARAPVNALGYIEFHIEQGPVLDNLNLPLAVVDMISGQTRADVTFTGTAAHAGTTPMRMRKDALACAAAWIAEVEREAPTTAGLVATVGRISVEPGAGNVVPERASVSLDARHPGDSMRKASVDRLSAAAEELASRRGLTMCYEPRLDQASVAMDPSLAAMLSRAVGRAGYPAHRMSSGAGHDAMILAGRMPVGMLFLRCAEGISHHPAESVREEDVAAALEASLAFLDELAQAQGV